MYKVVIVDDEPIIAEGLSKVVPWEKYGCKIAATAGNGQEGLEVIRKEQPNITFVSLVPAHRGCGGGSGISGYGAFLHGL